MAAPPLRRLAPLLLAAVLAAGCSRSAAPATGADATTGSAPTASPTIPATTPQPPDLSGATIDCARVEGPCEHGDDPTLDAMWEACADGNGRACDRLYYDSGFDTRYEQFGNTCGDRDVTVPCPRDLPS